MATNNGSFRFRHLYCQITLSQGSFTGGSGNSIIVQDLAMSVHVEKLGPPDFGKASVEIYGMTLEHMSQLTTLTMRPLYTRRNYLNVFASDENDAYSQIFAGSITNAAADLNAPNTKIKIDAEVGFWGRVTPQDRNVIQGEQPVAAFIEMQAKKCGMTFCNMGVTSQLRNAIFTGSPVQQARKAASQVGAELIIDDNQMILLPNGASVKGTVPKLSAKTGLLGYPVMTQNGIECRAIFNPNLRFAGLVEIESMVPKCSGQWRIIKLAHDLATGMPDKGNWESTFTAFYPNLSGVVGRFV